MGARTASRGVLGWLLVLLAVPLFGLTVWFLFHNPTIHGVPLNSADPDVTYVGDWTCLAPYDITLFHASNEYGGNEVADSDYARKNCNAAAQKSFAKGVIAGVLGLVFLICALVLRLIRRPQATDTIAA